MKQNPTKLQLSTGKLYVTSLALLAVGLGLRLWVWLKAAYSSCGLVCADSEFFGNVIAPVGMVIFLLGLMLLIATTIRYFMRRTQ